MYTHLIHLLLPVCVRLSSVENYALLKHTSPTSLLWLVVGLSNWLQRHFISWFSWNTPHNHSPLETYQTHILTRIWVWQCQTNFLLSMLKTVALLNIFVEIVIFFFLDSLMNKNSIYFVTLEMSLLFINWKWPCRIKVLISLVYILIFWWIYFSSSNKINLKGIVQPKIKALSSVIHHHAVLKTALTKLLYHFRRVRLNFWSCMDYFYMSFMEIETFGTHWLSLYEQKKEHWNTLKVWLCEYGTASGWLHDDRIVLWEWNILLTKKFFKHWSWFLDGPSRPSWTSNKQALMFQNSLSYIFQQGCCKINSK